MARLNRWLVAEFCAHALFNGWHLYIRDTDRHERNTDGSWGWLRRGDLLLGPSHAALAGIGIYMRPGSDGTCDDDGHAALARRFPIRRSRRRGGIPILIENRSITIIQSESRAARAKGG